MWRYLAAAFLFRVSVPGLGAVPVNALAVAAFAILGFAVPALWLLGLGLEVAWLFGLASNGRFQRLVIARDAASAAELDGRTARAHAERLSPEARALVASLDAKIVRTLELYAETSAETFVVETNREALAKLRSSYAELLGARQTLRSLEDVRRADARIRAEVATLEREIAEPGVSPLARDAKSSTLDALRRQLMHLERREGSLGEIESFLAQIEAQVDLALESAASKGRVEAISADVDVASFSLDALRADGPTDDRWTREASRQPVHRDLT